MLTDIDPVDLLAFGPHPDDIEIGLAGTVAVHTARGDRVGLCDLTRGELGSNGTPDEREREAEDARQVLGAAWRINLRWPDGGIVGSDAQIADVVRLVRQCRPRTVALPYWDDRHPDHVAASHVLKLAAFKSRLRGYVTDADPWSPEWICSAKKGPRSAGRRLALIPATVACSRPAASMQARAPEAPHPWHDTARLAGGTS